MKALVLDIETENRVVHVLHDRASWAASGCLEWQRGTSKGYGTFGLAGVKYLAHRAACFIAHGEAPEGKPHALHTCDNPPCVLGDHLYWGNDSDNARDRRDRGRASGGRAGATHCVNGHEFTKDNTYLEPRGWGRACKECRRARVCEFRARKAGL